MSVPNTVPKDLHARFEELAEAHGGAGYLRLGGNDYLFRRPSRDELRALGRDVINTSTDAADRRVRLRVYRQLLVTLVDADQRQDLIGYVNEKLRGEAQTRREEEVIAAADNVLGWLGVDAQITPMPTEDGLTVYVDQEHVLAFRLPTMEEISSSAKHHQVGRIYEGVRRLLNACAVKREDLEAAVVDAGPLCLLAIYGALIDAYDDARGSTEVKGAGF
jgi:hypothetical protein